MLFRLLYAAFFLLIFSNTYSQTSIDHWEAAVLASQNWRYFEGVVEPPLDWNSNSFDDSSWPNGPGGIGYGDGDDATLITDPTTSLYIRTTFDLLDTAIIAGAAFHIDFDDAFVAYLNGIEIARANLTSAPPAHDELSEGDHEAVMYTGGDPTGFFIAKDFLAANVVEGINTLAIQVHNRTTGSSDMTAIPFLSVALTASGSFYDPVPAWFNPDEFSLESTLPIVSINTFLQAIPFDDPRIIATMQIMDKGLDSLNSLFDAPNGYDGNISIEIRGSSSSGFEKKSYGLETQLPDGSNNNVSILGMPVENDWILYAPYSDKSLLRNVLIYDMNWADGRWTPRTRFCELVLNGVYQGVYVMMEKIKIDNDRVDIARLDSLDITGDQLTGGYILKNDRINGSGGEGWFSPYGSLLTGAQIYLQYEDPSYDELVPEQRDYIQGFMNNFEFALKGPSFRDSLMGHPAYLDGQSMIDFFLANEVTKNVDAYRLSMFFYKDKDSKNSRLQMGPIWDFNLGFGNADYCLGGVHTGWAYEFETICPDAGIPFWFDRVLEDTAYENALRCRWEQLRESIWHSDSVIAKIDAYTDTLNAAQIRNFNKWPILGIYVWPNNFVGSDYVQEVDYLKNWLLARLSWMDANIMGTCREAPVSTAISSPPEQYSMTVSPNPFTDQIQLRGTLKKPENLQLTIYSTDLRVQSSTELSAVVGTFSTTIPISDLPAGPYMLVVKQNGELVYLKKLIKQ